MLFALAEFWNDIVGIGGFVVGALGLLVGIVGFLYTIRQVKKTQTAAEAARKAASDALAESKVSFQRYITASANRALGELRLLVEYERWEPAAFRADDLAELLAQFVDGSQVIVDSTEWLRDSASIFCKKAKGESAAFPKNQWVESMKRLHAYLDRVRAPFGFSRSES